MIIIVVIIASAFRSEEFSNWLTSFNNQHYNSITLTLTHNSAIFARICTEFDTDTKKPTSEFNVSK